MGFLLALDLPTVLALNKVSKSSSDSHSSTGNKNLSKNKCSRKSLTKRTTTDVQGAGTSDAHVWSKPWMKVKEVTNIPSVPQPKICPEHAVDSCSNDATIQQCLRRSLSSIKSDPEQKMCLVKINNATSQIVSGLKYTVAFEAKDEISGKSYSSEAVIVSQPWTSQEPAVIDFKFIPRASI